MSIDRGVLQPGPEPYPLMPIAISAPRTMPVNVPFSNFGVTVVTMDHQGNVTIKVDQVLPVAE